MKFNLLLIPGLVCAKKFIVEFDNCDFECNLPYNLVRKHMISVECETNDLEKLKGVKCIEEDFEIKSNVVQKNPIWNLARVSNSNNYEYPGVATEIDIYIVDTGIDISHPEFEGRALWGNNFVDSINTDCNGHGTHVAGTVGSKTFGVNKECNLIAVKVLGCDGSGSSSGIIRSLDWIIERHLSKGCGRSVVNMSLGGPDSSQIFQDTINRATSLGIVIVVSAGNSSENACNSFPAGYLNVVTVGATTNTDDLASFSNYGACVDILAPGQDILSVFPNNETESLSGTSMSSPHVAGVIGLMFSYCNYTSSQVINAVKLNSRLNQIKNVPVDTVNLFLYSDGSQQSCPALLCGRPIIPTPSPTATSTTTTTFTSTVTPTFTSTSTSTSSTTSTSTSSTTSTRTSTTPTRTLVPTIEPTVVPIPKGLSNIYSPNLILLFFNIFLQII